MTRKSGAGIAAALLWGVVWAGPEDLGRQAADNRCLDALKLPYCIMWEPRESDWSLLSKAGILKVLGELQKEIEAIPPFEGKGAKRNENTISRIAAVYGENGAFTGTDGRTRRGKTEIGNYFGELAEKHAITDFAIRIRFVYAKEYSEVFDDPRPSPDDVIHSLYFILSSSYRLDGRPVDPVGSTYCPHLRVCDCNRSN